MDLEKIAGYASDDQSLQSLQIFHVLINYVADADLELAISVPFS